MIQRPLILISMT